MVDLSLQQASIIVDKALERARALGLAPLTVVVLDAGGHMKAAKREDGSSLLRPEIALGKAWGVLGMGFGGRELARRAARAPQFFTALTELAAGRMVAGAGGVLIRPSAGGPLLGAIGIRGGAPGEDGGVRIRGDR